MYNCAQNDTACYDSCQAQGTAAAQSQSDALYTCIDNAWVGSCQSVCTSESQECWSCVDQACAAEYYACYGY